MANTSIQTAQDVKDRYDERETEINKIRTAISNLDDDKSRQMIFIQTNTPPIPENPEDGNGMGWFVLQ